MQELFDLLQSSPYSSVQLRILTIIRTLSSSIYDALCELDRLALVEVYMHSQNLDFMNISFEILTNIIVNCALSNKPASKQKTKDLSERLINSLCLILQAELPSQTHMVHFWPNYSNFQASSLRKIFRCGIRVLHTYPEHAQRVTPVLMQLLPNIPGTDLFWRYWFSVSNQREILHFFYLYIRHNPESLFPYLSNLCDFMKNADDSSQPIVVVIVT